MVIYRGPTSGENAVMIRLCCPACKGTIVGSNNGLVCSKCAKTFPVIDGVPVFTETNAFYEGKWAEPDLSNGSPRNWLVKKQRFFLQQLHGQGSLLDLGCGGGWQLFCRTGETAGVDLSLASLKTAAQIYDTVALASLTELPFPTESFDFVVSSDVLGHIPLAEKDKVIGEIYRVLRRGGRTLHYIEADSDDPIARFEKRDAQLYERYLLSPEGHWGMETPEKTFERFRKFGFRPVQEVASYKLLMYVNRVIQTLDNEYKDQSKLISFGVTASRLMTRFKTLESVANIGIAMALEIGDRVFPKGWANGVLVEYEKL